MAQKAKKSTKTKKTATKTVTKTTKKPVNTTIKTTVTGKKEDAKPAVGKIICLVAIVVSLLVIMVAIMANSFGGNNLFVSDGTKYVLNVSVEDEEDNDENMTAIHTIYYYEGDKITGAETYYEFKTKEDAKAAYDSIVELLGEDSEKAESYSLSGKYIIIEAAEEDYADLTASEVKNYIELYEALQGNGDETVDDDTEDSTEETEE